MRLINVHTRLLEEFIGDNVPDYAILSHTWEQQEVSLQNFERDGGVNMLGYAKINGCCRLAEKQGIEYVWVDTCCIDKTSSAELSETINSMFRWYQQSKTCYVYLSDVVPGEDPYSDESSFRRSRWFTRGWTLQELLAPDSIQFFDMSWRNIGLGYSRRGDYDRDEIVRKPQLLHAITGINIKVLESGIRQNSRVLTVAEKLSWAAKRRTTRAEDIAYCLLGILGVNMPLLYGEGMKAFVRLQEQIISNSHDHSLLAWGLGLPSGTYQYPGTGQVLASSPESFKNCLNMSRVALHDPRFSSSHFMMTNRGLNIELPLVVVGKGGGITLALLSCMTNSQFVAIPLLQLSRRMDLYHRLIQSQPIIVPYDLSTKAQKRRIYIKRNNIVWPYKCTCVCLYDFYGASSYAMVNFRDFQENTRYYLKEVFPPRSMRDNYGESRSLYWEDAAIISKYRRLRRVFMLFTNDDIMGEGLVSERETQGLSLLLSIEFQKSSFRRRSSTQIRLALATTPALTVLQVLLSPDCSNIDYSRVSRNRSLDWRQEVALPCITDGGPQVVYKNVAIKVAVDGYYYLG